MIERGKNILRFTFFILLQVTIIRHLDMGIYFNPFLFIGAILMLPFRTDKTQVMVIAFATGLIIDMFYNTMGMNAAACTFMAYCRPRVLRVYAPSGDYNADGVDAGVTEPAALQSIASQAPGHGVVTTPIGIGLRPE